VLPRGTRWRWPVAALAAMVLATAAAPATAQQESGAAFPSGTWAGSATYLGALDTGSVSAFADSVINFRMLVSSGQVASGTIAMIGSSHSVALEGGSADIAFAADGTLSGPATRVLITAEAVFSGIARVEGYEVPIDISMPFGGSFSPSWATCTEVGGDLATEGRDIAAAQGLQLDAEAIFLAMRVSDAGAEDPDHYIPKDYADLVDDLIAAQSGDVPTSDLVDLIRRVEELNAQIIGAAACGETPAGFEEGLVKDDFFLQQLKAIYDKILKSPGDYSTHEQIFLLMSAVRVGVIGASAPDQGFSDSALLLFEAALSDALAATPDGEQKTIVDIYIAAKQVGLTDLAAAAEARLG
jgi:hypothetical protein